MAYNPYGPKGIVWSSEDHTPWNPPSARVGGLAIAAALTAGTAYGLYKSPMGAPGERALDYVQRTVRGVGYSSPLSILNTFRGAEFLSPWTSAASKRLATGTSGISPGQAVHFYEIGSEFLRTKETISFLKHEFGAEAFTRQGLNLDVLDNIALRFEQDKNGVGKLLARQAPTGPDAGPGGKWKLISNNVSLFETAPFESGLIEGAKHPNTNPAFTSYLQSTGFAEEAGIGGGLREGRYTSRAESIFQGPDPAGGTTRKRFAVINRDNLKRRYLTSVLPAFGMERFNRLIDQAIDQVPIVRNIADRYGVGLRVQTDTAPKMFARFGLTAAKLVGGGLAVSQTDWIRRQYGLPGEVIASGAVSVGAAHIFNKVTKAGSPLGAFAVGTASFFGQMILPGFDQGVLPGLWTSYNNLMVGRAVVGELSLMSSYRRTLEGFLPGISSWQTASLAGIGVMVASGVGMRPISEQIFNKLSTPDKHRLGLGRNLNNFEDLPKSLRMYQWEGVLETARGSRLVVPGSDPNFIGPRERAPWSLTDDEIKAAVGQGNEIKATYFARKKLGYKMYAKAYAEAGEAGVGELADELFARFQQAEQRRRQAYYDDNWLNRSLLDEIKEIKARNPGTDLLSRARRFGAETRAGFTHAFFGASMQGSVGQVTVDGVLKDLSFSQAAKDIGYKPILGRYGKLFVGTAAAVSLVTGGLLGSMEGPSDLMAQNAGKKLVAVRQGRFWEGGGTPFEGTNIQYWRPSAYSSYMSRSRHKATWGENEDQISPIRKFFLENFTYSLEESQYWDRPYPISGAAFQNIPIIGKPLAATVGQLIKPAKLMHTGEWMRVNEQTGNIEFAHKPEYHGPDMALGGKTPGIPGSPFSSGYVAGELNYQFRELEGLTGWAKNMISKAVTGGEQFGTQRPVLATAGAMTSFRDAFWDLNIGGGFFTTEPIRRFLPRKRTELNEYNPILNRMPTWLPERFHYGDPYSSLEMGHVRLPGPGYAAIHPELKGLEAENYPLMYQYKILADVAPMSQQFGILREQMYKKRAGGMLSEGEIAMMDQVDLLLNKRQAFDQYDPVSEYAVQLPGSGATQALWSTAQTAVRKSVAPVEYMIPMGFRPMQKLMPTSDPIEAYEQKRLYGTQFAFWDKPIRDWFRPSFLSAAHLMGYDGIPPGRKKADEISEYFDRLQFAKSMMLAQQAGAMGDATGKYRHLHAAHRTRYGINPQGNAMAMYQTLPDSEKEYFDSFAAAQGAQRRRILEMIPADQIALYKSIWKRADQGDATLYAGSQAQVNEAYLNKRFHEMQDYHYDQPMPGTDWIGWHEDAELDDVQLKYAQRMGMDIHEFDMFQKQARMISRKPYLDGAEDFLFEGPGPGRDGLAQMLYHAGGRQSHQLPAPQFGSVHNYPGGYNNTYGNFYMNDDRSSTIMSGISRAMGF